MGNYPDELKSNGKQHALSEYLTGTRRLKIEDLSKKEDGLADASRVPDMISVDDKPDNTAIKHARLVVVQLVRMLARYVLGKERT